MNMTVALSAASVDTSWLTLASVLDSPLVFKAYHEYERQIADLNSHLTGTNTSAIQACMPMRATAYLPIGLAPIFGISDSNIIQKAASSHLLLNHYAHLVDFVTDDYSASRGLIFHVSSLLLAKIVIIYSELTSLRSQFWKRWESYGLIASAAERRLWRHREALSAYDEGDVASMAQKSALMCSTAALYADIAGKWQSLDYIGVGLERLFLAVQLIDDLVDWDVDLRNGIYSYPIWLLSCHGVMLTPTDVSLELLRSHVADEILQQALTALSKARVVFLELGGTLLVSLIDTLSIALGQVCDRIAADRDDILKCPSDYDIRRYIRDVIDPRLAH